jgi:thioredoxin reductase (NADPH)
MMQNSLIVAIIGGGVAGMSCALWLKHLGFTPIIVEKKAKLGGQLLDLNRVNRWVLGSPGKTSMELADAYVAHINEEAIDILYQANLIEVTANKATGYDLFVEEAGTIRSFSVLAVVIATGLRVLGKEIFKEISGFQAIYENGLIYFFPVDHIDKLPELKGKAVAVMGGGENAHYTAKDIALAGAKVYLVIRSIPKARTIVRQEVEILIKQGLIIELVESQVTAFRQDKVKIEMTLLGSDGIVGTINVDMVFARIGFAANSQFLDTFEAFSGITKEAGYISTDSAKRTSLPWVYAIGDVTSSKHQSVVNAISDGAIVAQDLSERV